MVNIIYRHYKPGDDLGLTNLFNKAFQMNGMSIIRSVKNWNWRFVQSPDFKPEMCQIAEDIDNKIIVGAVYVNLVEEITLGGKQYLTGEINDVCSHPSYIRRGISKKLMKMAVDYMKKINCDISLLDADIKGFARKRIYQKFGFFDFEYRYIHFYLPLFGFFISYIPQFLNRIRMKFNKFFKDISYEINYNKKHFEYMEAANKIIPKYYEGFPLYTKKKVKWARINVPDKNLAPTYIIVKKRDKIIGGAVINHQNYRSLKYGIKIRLGMIHEIFLDKIVFNNKRDLYLGYIYLILKIVKIATARFINALLFEGDLKDLDLNKSLKGMHFLKNKSEVVMMKLIKENIEIPKPIKPLLMSSCLSLGVP